MEARDPTTPAMLEFQWPSTAVANAPIPRAARGIVWIIASLVIALIAVAGLIPVDQVVTARGLVVSKSPNMVVQPLETAIVRSSSACSPRCDLCFCRSGDARHAGFDA
jgi:HlyD family secretion protein